MAGTSDSSSGPGKPRDRDGSWASDLDVIMTIMIFVVVISIGVTQLLDTTHAISLSMTLQLTMWLVVLGLVVLLSIAYMICRTYLTGKESEAQYVGELIATAGDQVAAAVRANAQSGGVNAATGPPQTLARPTEADAEQAPTAAVEDDKRRDDGLAAQALAEQKEQLVRAQKDAEQARAAELKANEQRDEAKAAQAVAEQKLKDAQQRLAHVPPDAESPRNPAGGSDPSRPGQSPDRSRDGWVPPGGLRHLDGSARHAEAKEVFPDGFILVKDSISLTVDQLTGKQMAQYTVVDPNPSLKTHETVVNIPADNKPDTRNWPRYAAVKFDDLQVIPYETEQDVARGRMEYTLRAEGIQLAGQP